MSKKIKNSPKIKTFIRKLLPLEKLFAPIDGHKYATYFYVLEYCKQIMFTDYNKKDAKVLVKPQKSKKIYSLRLVEFIFHLFIWRLNIVLNVPITDEFIFHLHPLSQRRFEKIINSIAMEFVKRKINKTIISREIGQVLENINNMVTIWSSIGNCTYSLYDTIKLADRNIEFKSLLNTRISDDMPLKTVENFIKNASVKLKKLISSDKLTALYPYIESGSRMGALELTQMFVVVGPRSASDGSVFPIYIKSGYIHGIKSLSEWFIEAETARKALLLKSDGVPRSGYLSRKLNLLTLKTDIDYDVEDCHTPNYLNFSVSSKSHLTTIEGKYRILKNGNLKEVKLSDTHLVGTVVKLRSHICCSLDRTMNKICKVCFGSKHIMTEGTRIGGLPSIKLANPLSQKAMSAKHRSTVKSVSGKNSVFNRYFITDGDIVYINPDLENPSNITLILGVILDDTRQSNDSDDDSVDLTVPVSRIIINDHGNNYQVHEEEMVLEITEGFLKELKKYGTTMDVSESQELDLNEDTSITVNKIEHDLPLFTRILMNEELNKFLTKITNTIDGAETKFYTDYNKFMQDIADVFIMTGSYIQLIHIETIIFNLIRDRFNPKLRPDFSMKLNPGEYQFLRMTQAIRKHDFGAALAFESLKSVFADPSMFHDNVEGIFDVIFFKINALTK